jgi:hypothetical protein
MYTTSPPRHSLERDHAFGPTRQLIPVQQSTLYHLHILIMAESHVYNRAFDAVGNQPRLAQPRPTKELSWELVNHAKAYLEVGEYAKGYGLLYSLLAAGTSISVPAKPYVGPIAPAVQIAFASSLIAYPAITTKSLSPDAIKGSDAALRYLRCVHNTIEGPAYKTIRKAFKFPEGRKRRGAPAYKTGSQDSSPTTSGGDVERLDSKQANALSIWHCADDFWHIVGWAFNCSIAHEKRWARWKLWLEMMLDFLEADWDTCLREGKETGVAKEDALQGSLLWYYISNEQITNRNTRRRIIAAVLARADQTSLQHYPEVWKNESAGPKPREGDEKPTKTVDFDNGELGDYEDDGEDTVMLDVSKATPIKSKDSADPVEKLGGRDAIVLRQRFIAALVKVAQELPNIFTPLEDFCDTFTEGIRDAPTNVFAVWISTSRLPVDLQLALNGNLLLPLITSNLPNYFQGLPTQAQFETQLLPLNASSRRIPDKAKISLILEQMFLYMLSTDFLKPTEALRKAVESGIEARQNFLVSANSRKQNKEQEQQDMNIIETSSERLLSLLELLEISAGREPPPRKAMMLSFGSPLSSAPESEIDEND